MRDTTLQLIEAARQVLSEYNPMTLRQVYYQLVSKHIIENNRKEYQRLSTALVKARQEGMIPWEWLEDRTRRPRDVSMWSDLGDFIDAVKVSYRRDVWETQPGYVIAWLEKDALSGVFEEVTTPYGVGLVVGRGYNSWSIRKVLADRVEAYAAEDKDTTILYFGDMDPSGEDIVRDLDEGFKVLGVYPHVVKVALTIEQVDEYHLPPDFAKLSDTRSAKFVADHGEKAAVELDALPVRVLQRFIKESIEAELDMSALEDVRRTEKTERVRLAAMFE